MENDNLENLHDRHIPEGMEEVGGYQSLRPLRPSDLPKQNIIQPCTQRTERIIKNPTISFVLIKISIAGKWFSDNKDAILSNAFGGIIAAIVVSMISIIYYWLKS
jgi:hypothetical protein